MRSLLLLLCLTSVAQAQDEVKLEEVGVTLPENIAGIKHSGMKSYGAKELGYSQGYSSKMCTITLYVYDLGQADIPDGIEDAAIATEATRAAGDLKRAEEAGVYRNVKPMEGELELLEPVADHFRTSGFTFDIKGGGCRSYLLICSRNKNFFKVRLTQFVVDGQTNDEEVKQFLAALAKSLE